MHKGDFLPSANTAIVEFFLTSGKIPPFDVNPGHIISDPLIRFLIASLST